LCGQKHNTFQKNLAYLKFVLKQNQLIAIKQQLKSNFFSKRYNAFLSRIMKASLQLLILIVGSLLQQYKLKIGSSHLASNGLPLLY
jgi:hypothetical protein